MQIQIHDVQNEAQLIEIDLELKQVKCLPGHFNVKFVLDVLCDLSILQPGHIMHCLQNDNIVTMFHSKSFRVLFEKLESLSLHVFLDHHLEEQTYENGEHYPLQLMLKFIKRQIDKLLHLGE